MLRKSYLQPSGWLVLMGLVLGLVACAKTVTDDSISQALKAGFYSDPQLRNEPVQIAVSKGEVTLSGDVSNDAARLQAYKMASEAPGVKKVIDAMQVNANAAVAKEPEMPKSEGTEGGKTEPPTPAPPKPITVPAGTEVRVQMIDSINSKTGQVGAIYQASLYAPITVGEKVIVPKGTGVGILLTNAKQAGKIKGSSELELELDHLVLRGKKIPLKSSSYQQAGESRGKQTAKRTAVGTGIGAAIGAIAGGGKGAAIGAGIGAGGTLAYQAMTHGKEIQVPAETKLDFKLAEPFQVTAK
ncbi:MAG TPA: BON domain-containing protein [Terriglobia bacterium]|nr:BON domain-containing protein [Terriglobia bacterium]